MSFQLVTVTEEKLDATEPQTVHSEFSAVLEGKALFDGVIHGAHSQDVLVLTFESFALLKLWRLGPLQLVDEGFTISAATKVPFRFLTPPINEQIQLLFQRAPVLVYELQPQLQLKA